jgi:hypothetical protein
VGGLRYFGFSFTLFILSYLPSSFLFVVGIALLFHFKNKQTNKYALDFFCMAFLVVDPFGELHFSHWCTSF